MTELVIVLTVRRQTVDLEENAQTALVRGLISIGNNDYMAPRSWKRCLPVKPKLE